MRTILSGGKLVTPTCVLENHTLIFDGEVISAIIPDEQFKPEKKDHQINTPGKWITPGLIDIHVHGSNFADAMDPGSKTYQTLGSFFASRGVTGYLLTTGTASNEDITAVIEAFQDYAPSGDGAVALGIHLEGPYLCEERKGAQPAIHLRDPEPARYQSWLRTAKSD